MAAAAMADSSTGGLIDDLLMPTYYSGVLQRSSPKNYVMPPASYDGTHQQVNHQVEEAIVAYRREESARLAQDMPAKAITLAKDETFTGGLSLVATEPVSNYIILGQAAPARDHDTWQRLMEQALTGLHCHVI
jgi:hypothetical protein